MVLQGNEDQDGPKNANSTPPVTVSKGVLTIGGTGNDLSGIAGNCWIG